MLHLEGALAGEPTWITNLSLAECPPEIPAKFGPCKGDVLIVPWGSLGWDQQGAATLHNTQLDKVTLVSL